MRRAFVVQLGSETKPTEGRFEGWVEEVDSCTALRFHSSEALLKFLGERFDLAMASTGKDRAMEGEPAQVVQKNSRRKRRSP